MIEGHFNYEASLFLVLFGLFGMISLRNMLKKMIALVILQTGVILFYLSLAFKHNGDIPILPHHAIHEHIETAAFANPLPHALMLTAIVVGVATLGVGLVLLISIYHSHGTLEEDEVLEKIKKHSLPVRQRGI